MKYIFRNIYYDLEDIQGKLINFSMDNLKWSCIFSGMGIIDPITQKEADHILKMNNFDDSNKALLSNFVPLKCIYSKGSGIFTEPPSEIINPGCYMWDFNSFNKKISVEAQAYAILSLCTAAKMLYEHNIMEGYIMLKSAIQFYEFISTYLRNQDGLFISGQDKTKNFDRKYRIKLDSEEANLYHQVLVFEATLLLYNMTSKKNFKEYHNQKSEGYLAEGLSLFKYLYENHDLLFDLPTKELSLCISSFARCLSLEVHEDLCYKLKLLVGNLTAELETRVKITGEVSRGYEDSSNASLITHFRVNSALLEGYKHTNIENFFEAAHRIYHSVQDLFDSSIGLFLTGSHKSINYSISDISEIIKHFLINVLTCNDTKSINSLKEFYYYSIERTSIIQAIVKNSININDKDYILTENIPLMDEINKAPVFLKNFKLKFKKKSVEFETSKYFSSENSLYASYIFLHYLNIGQENSRSNESITEEDSPVEVENSITSEATPMEENPQQDVQI